MVCGVGELVSFLGQASGFTATTKSMDLCDKKNNFSYNIPHKH